MSRLHAKLIYEPVTALRGEAHVFRYLEEARGLAQLTADGLRAYQGALLARLLNFAKANNAFHRDRWPGFYADAPQEAFAVLKTLPFMSRRDIQNSAATLLSETLPRRRSRKSTGGSTGEPVRIEKDSAGVAWEMAISWMALEWFGIRPGDRSVRFWGTPLTRKRRLRFRLADIAMNRIRLSAFDLDDADLKIYWERCLRFRPRWFYGYASLIHLFATYIEKEGLDGRRLGLSSVVPTSEPLSQTQRDDIARVYGAPIQNEYGCGEVGAIAYECDRGLLHIMSPNVVVELLNDDGHEALPGEVGEVVVTDLRNYSMPLVRYRLGDFAVRGKDCGCGRPFPTIERVWGRIHDAVFTPAGRRWHGEKFDYLMAQLAAEVGGFSQYQVVQDGPDTLDVRLVAEQPISEALEQRIREYARERLDGMMARVRRVDRTERAPSGKLHLVRNDWHKAGATVVTHGSRDNSE
jgi:phenylacetate-CoA ligase